MRPTVEISHQSIESPIPVWALIAIYQRYQQGVGPGLKSLTGVASIDVGRARPCTQAAGQMFSITSGGRAVLGLNSAAWGELPATGLQGAALRLSTEW